MDVFTINGKVALETALSHLAAAIEESGARVTHYTLPSISADETQMVHCGIAPQIMSIDPRSGKSGHHDEMHSINSAQAIFRRTLPLSERPQCCRVRLVRFWRAN